MSSGNPWKILDSKIVYKNPWIRVREDAVILPNGGEGIYAYLESDDSVMITVLNDNNELYLINKFSYPDQSWNWELPGGGGDKEDLVKASQRELLEETGINAASWEKLGKTRVCNGLMSEKMATYLARDLTITEIKTDANEAITEGRFFTLEEVTAMITKGLINDGQSITSIHLLHVWLNTLKEQS